MYVYTLVCNLFRFHIHPRDIYVRDKQNSFRTSPKSVGEKVFEKKLHFFLPVTYALSYAPTSSRNFFSPESAIIEKCVEVVLGQGQNVSSHSYQLGI